MRDRWNMLILFWGSFVFYLLQAAPSVTAGDAGEFITAAGTLSLAHAPSFPLFMVAGRCFSELLPFATVAFRLNVFSAFTSALTLVACYGAGRVLMSSRVMSFSITLLIGVSTSFVANSLVTEVFSLNALLSSVLFLILIQIHKAQDNDAAFRKMCLFAFVLGLALGNHHIVVFLGVGAVLVAYDRPALLQLGAIKNYFLCGVLGFSIYLALPVRSAQEPPLNWGQPTTPAKLYRTITRKDYGSLRLALGDSPTRNWKNTERHLLNFGRQLAKEMTWPLFALAGLGLLVGLFRMPKTALVFLLLFLFSGPLFYLLGNLPFTSQSEGIMGRFYIMPVIFLLMSLHLVGPRGILLVPVLLFLGVQKGGAIEWDHRVSTLVLDYGRAMLRSLPPQSILFMDGGDDAFYSLAMLRYVDRKREDVTLHDRGGLVFRNPYGKDFRSLPKEAKAKRRADVERSFLGVRPIYYSTMDTEALPGASLQQRGFLYEAGGSPDEKLDWSLMVLRSLYPEYPHDYRTRALAAFFPYMQGKLALQRDDYGKTIEFFKRAQIMGHDVDWLKTNLGTDYAKLGYNSLMRDRLALAEWVYRQWIDFDPDSMQAHSNLGVVLERMGKLTEAKLQYHIAAERFSQAADPVFNLAVLAWKDGNWNEVVEDLEEVLRRNPNHLQARAHLEDAKKRLRESRR